MIKDSENEMKLSIHQPSYFPWLGLLSKIANSDMYVLMDDVQLADRAYQHRNIFLDKEGSIRYLTIPINKKGYRKKSIKELSIANSEWQKQHVNFLKINYGRHLYFDQVYCNIKNIYKRKYDFLIDVLVDSMRVVLQMFSIDTKVVMQSDIAYDKSKKKNDLIISLVQALNAQIYLSGFGARDYIVKKDFQKKNIKLMFNIFKHPTYYQVNSPTFVFGLSSLDILFNLGIEESIKIFNMSSENNLEDDDQW